MPTLKSFALAVLLPCGVAILTLALSPTQSAQAADAPKKLNVLFIAIDDLNDWVGAFGGNPQAKTPNIDRLAARGTTFARAYCAAPLCNPSRTALMSGLRPSTSGVYGNDTDWRPLIAAKQVDTLGQHFLKHGYYVAGAGKIFHGGFPSQQDWQDYGTKGGGGPAPKGSRGVGGIAFGAVDAEDKDLGDYDTVDYCLTQLKQSHDKPFFLACGLHKPHMPWFVPRKYYDMFPLDQVQLPKVLETDLDDVPAAGVAVAGPQGDHRQILESGRWKEAVQAYLAAGAYADALIGRLIEGLDQSAYKDNTMIVLWGDHGWHLGEKQHWRKWTLWEEATRAPLLFVVPGMTKPGSRCERTVDFMSIYPTLADLCGLPIPSHVEGSSIRKLLENPAAAWDRPAVTTRGYGNHAVRSEKWRYIRYNDGSEELYDEQSDPLEWKNLAGESQYASLKTELAQWLPKTNADDPSEKRTRKAKNLKKKEKQAVK